MTSASVTALFALAITVGCGSSVTPTATVDASPIDASDGATEVAIDTALPPPDVTEPTPTTTKWFAIRKMFLGLSDRSGISRADAWKQYGLDLDGRVTTREDSATSASSCKRRAGSPTSVLTDGELGRDNNFGQHFMAVLKSLKADVEDAANRQILDGSSTLLLRLENVVSDDNPSVPGSLFLAGRRLAAPKLDGSDVWPIDGSSVTTGMEPSVRFPKGSMKGSVWTSGPLGSTSADIPLPVFIGTTLVPLESVVLTFHTKTGADGTLAGGSPTSKFIRAIESSFRRIGICPGNATYEQIVTTVAESADLVSGAPSLQDTARECDALSVGIGFTAVPVQPSTSVLSPLTPPPDECGP